MAKGEFVHFGECILHFFSSACRIAVSTKKRWLCTLYWHFPPTSTVNIFSRALRCSLGSRAIGQYWCRHRRACQTSCLCNYVAADLLNIYWLDLFTSRKMGSKILLRYNKITYNLSIVSKYPSYFDRCSRNI